jgi:hypothetical protein
MRIMFACAMMLALASCKTFPFFGFATDSDED